MKMNILKSKTGNRFAVALLACLMPLIALTAKGDGIKIPTIWPPRTLPQTPGQNEGNPSAVEPLKDRTAIQIADSATTWLDVRKAKTYELEDTIPVSHSASNWVNAVATEDEATVSWSLTCRETGEPKTNSVSCTDDVPLTVTLKELGSYTFLHKFADTKQIFVQNVLTVVKRQLGTEAEPWIISKEDDPNGEVRAFMLSETELCIEGDGITMLDFGGCGPWGENVRSVYFANPPQNISPNAFLGCTNLCAVTAKGEATFGQWLKLKDSGFFNQPGVDQAQVKWFDLEKSDPVELISANYANGRVEVRCVVYDKNAASTPCGSNVKLGLSVSIMGEEKEVRHLHRVENGGIEYDDMMLWLKKDGRPKFVTLIWDAELDLTPEELAELDFDNISVNGTNCADALVTVRNGEFVGVLDEETKVRAWKGIPYAAQPTGANRWKAMGDPEPSGETFTAKQFGHAAIQLLDPTETGGYVEQGDDCLVLNVWSTDPSVEVGCDWGKRPVMVYIHGGGFLMGGSADIHYDGRNIVERNKDVVVVTINYRVGLLGYIDLKNVPGGEAFADSPNLATLDQRQALKWVRDNIAAFGGDRDNVTIFGESAGGASVAVHLTSPESAPYFRRAIQMSGALDFTMTEKAYEERQLTERLVAAVAELRFGNVALSNRVDMAVLQSLTPDEIRTLMMTPYADLENPGLELAPDDLSCVPGIGAIWNYPMCGPRGVVPVDPFKAFETNGVSNGKDYMVGTVRDEMRYFTDYDGPDDPLRSYYTGFLSDRMRQNRYWFGGYAGLIDEFLDDYEGDGVRDEMDTRYPGIWKKTALEDMLFFRMAAIRMADIHAGLAGDSQSGTKGKTYMYRFDKGREYADRPWAGAGHACELDYFFHNTSCVVDGPIDEGLADKANAAFVNFARCGNPNGDGGTVGEVVWDEYDATDRRTLIFNGDCTTSCVDDPDKTYYEFLKPAYDTYYSGRSNAERRSKTGLKYVREPEPPAGTADDPWQVGRTAGDEVIAYTNAAGRLFVEGTGDIRDFYALGGGLWFGETTVEAEFGAGVTSIGANMLSTCGELERIVMYAEEPPTLGDNALPPAWQLEAIYVPEDSYSAYVNAWPEYEDVIQGAVPGSEEKPWKVGASASDTVTAYTNGTGRLCIVGEGAMAGFDGSAPWAGLNVMECLVAAGVTEIGKSAFAECPTLGTLVLYAETPPALGADNLSDVTIFVPAGAADDYRAVWPSKLGDQIDEMHSARGANIEKHLYEVEYKWWNADRANDVAEALVAFVDTLDWLEEIRRRFFPYEFFDWYEGVANRALCTSCRNGNFVGRNFDWGYDDVDECVMRVPAAEGRLASVGVASRFFPQALQDAFDVDDFLPELTMDGINEKGVAINVNVVPGGDNGWTTGTNHGAKRLCAGFAVRTVLDRATNAAHAVEILQSRDIYSLKPLEFHWMISDADESYVVECANNQLVVLKAKNARPKMANFYVSHSPNVAEYEVVSGNEELTEDEHTPHAMGIERYASVSNGLESVGSVEAMFSRMTNVWYKAKYLPGNEERFWSDLNGAPVPGMGDERFEVGDDLLYGELRLEAFKSLQANYEAVTDYEARWGNRDTLEHDPTLTNQVVHTVHTSIYDLERRELTVCVQEDVRTRRVFALAGPLAPEGSKENPWQVGTEGREAEVTAWTNGTGTLVVEGTGAVGWAPWAEDADGITELVKDKGVTGLDGIMSTLPALTTVNGLTLDELAVVGMVGAAKAGFSAIAVEGGTAQLGVVVSTNGDLTAATESWGKAKVEDVGLDKETGEAILTIPAPADKGFFIVNPKPDVPSNLDLPPIVTVK